MIRIVAIGLTLLAMTIWLPIVRVPAAQSTTPIVVSPPPGVTLHLTNPQLIQDRTGALFAATRAKSEIGGVVWMVKDGVTTVVLQLGPEAAFANGELVVWPDGQLYYITVPQDASRIVAYPIAEWTP